MIAVLQRVSSAAVRVADEEIGRIGTGLLVLVGVLEGDEEADAEFLARRLVHLRIFPDGDGRMNRSLLDAGGEVLLVSQFTLAGDTRRGRRPSFTRAAAPERAESLIAELAERLAAAGPGVRTGSFGAHMEVELINDGPVTLLLDSRESRRGNRRQEAPS